jgi:DNA-directed RNA polymerase subunit RPC12/RpoP
LELLCYSVLKEIWKDAEWQDKRYGVEADVLLPGLKVAIEIDGAHWHIGKLDKDIEKNKTLESKGYLVIRLRERPLKSIGSLDIEHLTKDDKKEVVLKLVRLIESRGSPSPGNLNWENIYRRYEDIKRLSVRSEKSLAVKFPAIAKELHLDKNGTLTPRGLSYGSKRVVWWRCLEGHEWEAAVCNRTSKTGTKCPFCAGNRAHGDNCLAQARPDLILEWSKSNDFSPFDITPRSHRKAKWACKCGAEYEMSIDARTRGQRCPVCRYKRMAETRRKSNKARLLCRMVA